MRFLSSNVEIKPSSLFRFASVLAITLHLIPEKTSCFDFDGDRINQQVHPGAPFQRNLFLDCGRSAILSQLIFQTASQRLLENPSVQSLQIWLASLSHRQRCQFHPRLLQASLEALFDRLLGMFHLLASAYRYAASSSPCFLISALSSQTMALVRASIS